MNTEAHSFTENASEQCLVLSSDGITSFVKCGENNKKRKKGHHVAHTNEDGNIPELELNEICTEKLTSDGKSLSA